MIRNRHLRWLLGLVLGGCAGLSFTISVLPVVLQLGRAGDPLALTRALAPFGPWMALLWAAGGWSAARIGAPLPAAVGLGACGAASGALLAIKGADAPAAGVALAVVGGLIYGGLGGLILGRVLGAPPARKDKP